MRPRRQQRQAAPGCGGSWRSGPPNVKRCPYLQEFYRERRGPLRVYHYDCAVDGQSHRKRTLRDSPPICLRNYEDCPLYRQRKADEDRTISRYTD